MAEAIGLLDRAIELDPGFALTLALSGYIRAWAVASGGVDDVEKARRLALDLGQRALRAGGDDPEVMTRVAGAIGLAGGDGEAARVLIERSLAVNPGAAFTWIIAGFDETYRGRPEEAIRAFETHGRLDPRSPDTIHRLSGMGWALFELGRYAEAVACLRESLSLNAGNFGPQPPLVASLAHLGRVDEAKAALAGIPRGAMDGLVGLLRHPEQGDRLRAGLRMAGADV